MEQLVCTLSTTVVMITSAPDLHLLLDLVSTTVVMVGCYLSSSSNISSSIIWNLRAYNEISCYTAKEKVQANVKRWNVD